MQNTDNDFEMPSEEEIRQKIRKEQETKKTRVLSLVAILVVIALLAGVLYLKNKPSTKTPQEQYIEDLANGRR